MPKLTIKNNHPTQPRGFYDAAGHYFIVPPRGGEAEAEMKQEDVNFLHHVCEQPDMAEDKKTGRPAMLEVSGAGPKQVEGKPSPSDAPKVSMPDSEQAAQVQGRADHKGEEGRGAQHRAK